MPQIKKLHLVQHTPIQMFELVADLEKYPEFVPLCQSLTIRSSRKRDHHIMLIADMTIAYKMFCETFTSQVVLNREALAIDVKYLDGPFHHMDNQWRFLECGKQACEIDFMLDYKLRSRPLQMVMGSVFDLAFGKFTSAFEKRADAIYPKKNPRNQRG